MGSGTWEARPSRTPGLPPLRVLGRPLRAGLGFPRVDGPAGESRAACAARAVVAVLETHADGSERGGARSLKSQPQGETQPKGTTVSTTQSSSNVNALDVDQVERKVQAWIDRGVCPRAGHAIASEDDLYVVPSSVNVQCRECRKEIRRTYRHAVKSGAHVPIAGAYQGQGVDVRQQPISDSPAAPAAEEVAPETPVVEEPKADTPAKRRRQRQAKAAS